LPEKKEERLNYESRDLESEFEAFPCEGNNPLAENGDELVKLAEKGYNPFHPPAGPVRRLCCTGASFVTRWRRRRCPVGGNVVGVDTRSARYCCRRAAGFWWRRVLSGRSCVGGGDE
jgi:hypothetical protein